jgi:hypothetical protein
LGENICPLVRRRLFRLSLQKGRPQRLDLCVCVLDRGARLQPCDEDEGVEARRAPLAPFIDSGIVMSAGSPGLTPSNPGGVTPTIVYTALRIVKCRPTADGSPLNLRRQ